MKQDHKNYFMAGLIYLAMLTLVCFACLIAKGQTPPPLQHSRVTTNPPLPEVSGVLQLDTTQPEGSKLSWNPNIVGAVFPTNAYPIVSGTILDMSPSPNHQYQYVITNNDVNVTGFSGLRSTNVNYGQLVISNSGAGSIRFLLPTSAHYIGINSTNTLYVAPGTMAWASVVVWGPGTSTFTDIVDNAEGGYIGDLRAASLTATNGITNLVGGVLVSPSTNLLGAIILTNQIWIYTNPVTAGNIDATMPVQITNCTANPTINGVVNVPAGLEWHSVMYILANGGNRTVSVTDPRIHVSPTGTLVATNGSFAVLSSGGVGQTITGAVFVPFP